MQPSKQYSEDGVGGNGGGIELRLMGRCQVATRTMQDNRVEETKQGLKKKFRRSRQLGKKPGKQGVHKTNKAILLKTGGKQIGEECLA